MGFGWSGHSCRSNCTLCSLPRVQCLLLPPASPAHPRMSAGGSLSDKAVLPPRSGGVVFFRVLPSFSLLICLLINLLEDSRCFWFVLSLFHAGFSASSCQLYVRYLICVECSSLVAQLVKNPPAVAGDLGLIPGLGRSPGEGKDYPLQYSGLENSKDCVVSGVAESDTTE